MLGYYREYRWLKAFGGGHEAFLDTPVEVIEWLLEIDSTTEEQ